METLLQDVRYTLRTLLKNPGFAFVVVLALTLGIGANSLIFSVVNSVLLRPLPFSEPDRLVQVWSANHQKGLLQIPVSLPDYVDFRDHSESFEQAAIFRPFPFNLTGIDEPERVWGAGVSGNLFNLLGSPPALGRTFSADEAQPTGAKVVIISNGLWQRQFGSDKAAVGRTVEINGERYEIIGVMPPSFQFPQQGQYPIEKQAELWVPLGYDLSKVSRGTRSLGMVARLKPGVSLTEARAELKSMAAGMEQQYPDSNKSLSVELVPVHEQVVGKIRPALIILLGAVGFVLLIACANVANLLLVRATGRQREMSIRLALGATRKRLLRQLLTESAILSLLGGALGFAFAYLGTSILRAANPGNIPRLRDVSVDGRVLVFTLGIALLTTIVFGFAPALQATKPDLTESLKEGSQTTSEGRIRRRMRDLLAVGEIALSLVLLIGAGLLIKSFLRLERIDPGFNTERLLTVEISLPRNKYPDGPKRAAFVQQLLARVEGMPGVQLVAAGAPLPLSGGEEVSGFSVEGHPPDTPDSKPVAAIRSVAPNYFRVMGIPILEGREFSSQDVAAAPGVAIINENFAKRMFQGEDPIGKRITLGNSGQAAWLTVVGTVADLRHSGMGLKSDLGFEVYRPYFQEPWPLFSLAARTTSDPISLGPGLRARIMEMDPDLPAYNVRTMDQLLAASVAQPRFYMLLLGIFACVALVLATVGIYSVIAYSVSQRRHEIGIRMAMGAQSADVVKLIMKQGMIIALIGMAIGLIAAVALTRIMESLLFEVTVTDPITFIVAALLLVAVALLASFVPARRTTGIDPIAVLRHQ